jgi:hypothetical protein
MPAPSGASAVTPRRAPRWSQTWRVITAIASVRPQELQAAGEILPGSGEPAFLRASASRFAYYFDHTRCAEQIDNREVAVERLFHYAERFPPRDDGIDGLGQIGDPADLARNHFHDLLQSLAGFGSLPLPAH